MRNARRQKAFVPRFAERLAFHFVDRICDYSNRTSWKFLPDFNHNISETALDQIGKLSPENRRVTRISCFPY